MEVEDDGVQLGWEGDEGVGDLLIERLLTGSLTVLFEPAPLLEPDEEDALFGSEQRRLTVFDPHGTPRATVRVMAVFDTTWGAPDARLVAGDGYGDDVDGWRRATHLSLSQALADAGEELAADTRLVVQQVEVIDRW